MGAVISVMADVRTLARHNSGMAHMAHTPLNKK
jgi:hypothetical protein